jgi:hypothetical protein
MSETIVYNKLDNFQDKFLERHITKMPKLTQGERENMSRHITSERLNQNSTCEAQAQMASR